MQERHPLDDCDIVRYDITLYGGIVLFFTMDANSLLQKETKTLEFYLRVLL